jgi:phosphoglycolate phosphatase-like HAD superfamily hydrolase
MDLERRWIQGKDTLIELVIFDLDGTLIKLPVRYDLLRTELKDKFKIEGEFFLIPMIVDSTNGKDELKRDAFELICQEECNSINNLEIHEGAIEVIKEIHARNKKLAMVTLQCERAANQILEIMGIKNLFSNIFTRDNYTNRYDQIIHTMKKFDVNALETLMIGDRINDFESAEKAGCKSIIIRRGEQEGNNDMNWVKNNMQLKDEIVKIL